jgi:flagellar biosynthetic protein FliR
MDVTTIAITQFIRFLLVLFRMSGILVLTPVLGGAMVPVKVRVMLAMVLSLALFPMVESTPIVMPMTLSKLVLGLGGELALGLICGFMVNLVFLAAQMAGEVLARQMGISLGDVFNPLFEVQTPVVGQFYYLFAVVIFVSMNGHHILVKGLLGTFERVPLMGATFQPAMVSKMAGLMGHMFILMLKLSAPVLVSLLLIEVALGIIARTVPQMNVLIVGFPLKICVGLIIAAMSLAGSAKLLTDGFYWIGREIDVLTRMCVAR